MVKCTVITELPKRELTVQVIIFIFFLPCSKVYTV